jgi:hypothetical protein
MGATGIVTRSSAARRQGEPGVSTLLRERFRFSAVPALAYAQSLADPLTGIQRARHFFLNNYRLAFGWPKEQNEWRQSSLQILLGALGRHLQLQHLSIAPLRSLLEDI